MVGCFCVTWCVACGVFLLVYSVCVFLLFFGFWRVVFCFFIFLVCVRSDVVGVVVFVCGDGLVGLFVMVFLLFVLLFFWLCDCFVVWCFVCCLFFCFGFVVLLRVCFGFCVLCFLLWSYCGLCVCFWCVFWPFVLVSFFRAVCGDMFLFFALLCLYVLCCFGVCCFFLFVWGRVVCGVLFLWFWGGGFCAWGVVLCCGLLRGCFLVVLVCGCLFGVGVLCVLGGFLVLGVFFCVLGVWFLR